MHSISGRFCSAVPGMLMNHSVLVSWPEMSATDASARSAVAGCSGFDIGGGRSRKLIADGADRERVMARGEAVGGEAVTAGRIGDDGDGERRAVALGADQHAFHRAFLRGGDVAGQGKARGVEVPRRRRPHGRTANQNGKQGTANAHGGTISSDATSS